MIYLIILAALALFALIFGPQVWIKWTMAKYGRKRQGAAVLAWYPIWLNHLHVVGSAGVSPAGLEIAANAGSRPSPPHARVAGVVDRLQMDFGLDPVLGHHQLIAAFADIVLGHARAIAQIAKADRTGHGVAITA